MRSVPIAGLTTLLLLCGCRGGQHLATAANPSPGYKTYKLHGTVVGADPAKGETTLRHEAIPGFMEAMTMPYKLKDGNIVAELHPGDVVTADVEVSPDPDADAVLDHVVVVAQGRPDYKPAIEYHVPAPGDRVPDFKMRNQDGRQISLGQFKGQTLLLTFIYTRCPLPNFCPRVTRNFAAIETRLAATAGLLQRTHLLCISFDPENDTPERLRAYGAAYIGSDAKTAFAHWDFAAPQRAELGEMAKFFDLGLTIESDGTITHSLSTTLIGPDGKVVMFYPGNEWTVDEAVGDMRRTMDRK